MYSKNIVYLLSLSLVLAMSSTDIYVASLPRIASDFGISPDKANLTINLFAIGNAIGCIIWGFISDRFGRRSVFLGGLLAYLIIAVGIAVMPSISAIIILRFLQGATVAIFIVGSRQIINDLYTPAEQVGVIGTLTAGIILSPALAPVIGAYIAKYSSWRFDFVFSALFAAALLWWGWRSLPESTDTRIPLPKASQIFGIYRSFFTSMKFFWLSMMIMLTYGAYYIFISMSSFAYIDHLGFQPQWYSKIYIALALAYLVGNSIMKHLNKRGWSRKNIIVLGLVVSLLGAGVDYFCFANFSPITLGLILAGGVALIRAGYALMQSPTQVAIMQNCADRVGVAVGLLYFLMFAFGGIISQLVASWHESALEAMVISMSVLIVLTLISYLLLINRKREPETETADSNAMIPH